MSGRPGAPSYSTRTFAPDTNYPAGSETWNNNPTKVEPPGAPSVGLSPDQPLPAQYLNRLFFDAYTQDANAKAYAATLLEFVGQAQALNWRAKVSGPAATTQNGAFFAAATGKWYVVANTEDVRSSVDQGFTWVQESGVAAGAGEHCFQGDADASGNVVITTDTQYIFALNATTATWTKVDAYGAALLSSQGRVVFDPVHSKWIWIGVSGTSAVARVSSDRAAWSAGGGIGGASWTPNAIDLAINKTSGRAVIAGLYGAAIRVAYTDDAGTTWTTLASDLATTIASPTVVALTHNADEGAFYLTVGETSGTHSCEVWRSADGAAWTKVCTLATACVHRIAAFGALLVSIATLATRQEVVYSVDSGATWQKIGMWPGGVPKGMFAGAGRALLVTASDVFVGHAMGKPELGALT